MARSRTEIDSVRLLVAKSYSPQGCKDAHASVMSRNTVPTLATSSLALRVGAGLSSIDLSVPLPGDGQHVVCQTNKLRLHERRKVFRRDLQGELHFVADRVDIEVVD